MNAIMKTTIILDIKDPKNLNTKDLPNADIILFSDEWKNRQSQCQNFIDGANGKHKRRINARQCVVEEIDKSSAREFLEEYHIQGSNNLSLVYFGILKDEELLGILSLGRHSRQISQNRIVLDRLCFKKGTYVVGGSSKLFKKCVQWSKDKRYDEIISFSDNRLTTGITYEKLGFSIEKNYRPDYSYVDINNPSSRYSKQSQKKSSVKCPSGLTEYEWAKQRGLERIWDRGKKRWTYLLDSKKRTWREERSKQCADQHSQGLFKHSHIRGYFKSKKNKKEIYYGSSYELRCLYLLEQNDKVLSFSRVDSFKNEENRWRSPDIKVNYKNKTIILEVKPQRRLNEPEVVKQISDSIKYAEENGWEFEVWTEENSGLKSERTIINWAKRFIAETTGDTSWIEKQKENGRKKSKKHYHKHIAQDKVEVFCEFCNKVHEPIRLTYEKNIKRNGEYICERYGGHLAGSKPKKKKFNPYASEGKKQCNKCKSVLPLEKFGNDKHKSDGKATRCKSCRNKSSKS